MAQPPHLETVTVTPPNTSPAQWALTDLMFPHARLLHQFCTRGTRFIAVTAVANCNTHAAMTTKWHTTHIYIDVGLITATGVRHCNTNVAMTTKQYICIYIYVYVYTCMPHHCDGQLRHEALQHNVLSWRGKTLPAYHNLHVVLFFEYCIVPNKIGGGGGGGGGGQRKLKLFSTA